MLRTRALTFRWAPWTRTWSSPCWRSPGWRRSHLWSWSWRPGPGCSGPYPALHVGSLARLVTAHQALPPPRRAVCTRALCGPRQHPGLGPGALHAGALLAGGAPSCGLGAGVPGLDAQDPLPLSMSAAWPDWSRLTRLCLLRAAPCARGPCAARCSVLELSTLRSPRLQRPLRWSSTWRLGLGCSGPGAPTFMWAARPDWTRFTKLCLLRATRPGS